MPEHSASMTSNLLGRLDWNAIPFHEPILLYTFTAVAAGGVAILAAITYFPVFKGLTHFANPALEKAVATAPITVVADPRDCSFQFDATNTKTFTRSCDVIKTALAKGGTPYTNEAAPPGAIAKVQIGTGSTAVVLESFPGDTMSKDEFKAKNGEFTKQLKAAIGTAGYPSKATEINTVMVIILCAYLVILVTMVYGPIAAWLVELFPTRIRYTSMSLPYHVGNGWFGGFLPVTSFAIVAATGDIYSGLWYPVIVALMTLIVGSLFLRETKDDHLKQ